jgi:hypothetical protein
MDYAGTNIPSSILPYSSDDTYPTHIDTFGKGGYRTVATSTDRDAIPADRRSEGMLVYVIGDGLVYQLKGGTTNDKWQILTLNSGNNNIKFINLTDVPAAYTNAASNFVKVKADATGLEFVDGLKTAEMIANANHPDYKSDRGILYYKAQLSPTNTYTEGIDNQVLLWMNAEELGSSGPIDRTSVIYGTARHTITPGSSLQSATDNFGGKAYNTTTGAYQLVVNGNIDDWNYANKAEWTIDFWGNSGSDGVTFLNVDSLFYIGTGYQNNKLSFYETVSSNLTLRDSCSFSSSTWIHVAIEKYNGSIRLYINGVARNSVTSLLPANATSGPLSMLAGHGSIDDLRISNVARYKGSNFTPRTAPYAYRAVSSDIDTSLYFKTKDNVRYNLLDKLYANKTINFLPTDGINTINTLLGSVPRDLNAYTLTLQFGDGNYNFYAGSLQIGGFKNGTILILGDTSETTDLHTNQGVVFNWSNLVANQGGLYICQNFGCIISVNRIKFQSTTPASEARVLFLDRNPGSQFDIYANYFVDSTANSRLLACSHVDHVNAFNNYFTAGVAAITSYNMSTVFSTSNYTTGTSPSIGLNALSGGTIIKNGAQPSGSTAESTVSGGVIR